MRDVYGAFLKYRNLLPDAVGRQNPWVLFRVLDSMEEDDEYDVSDNEHLMMFYGK